MDSTKKQQRIVMSEHGQHEQQQQQQQMPNRSISNNRISLIPPVTTNRHHNDTTTDELNKSIGSDFQDIQIRTLTKWINIQLSQVNEHINSIDKDLKDGTKLLKLLSVVSNNSSLKPERGHMRIHNLSNVAQALKFLQDQWGADSLPAIGSEAIVNGDVKSTLAITFFIMLKYQIHPILDQTKNLLLQPPPTPLPTLSASRTSNNNNNNKSVMAEAKLALLYWVRGQLEDYVQHHIISTIQDFSRSWRSGLAFCLLIHRFDPNLIPSLFTKHIQHVTEKDTWHTLLVLAFTIGNESLNIPQYLEPADLLDVDYPHEPSVMMYVSEMYKVMSKNRDEDILLKKRLHDISLVSTQKRVDSFLMTTPLNSNSYKTSTPSTPEPEVVLDDVYQQLDMISDLLSVKEDEKSRLILDQANRMIHTLSASEEKQALLTKYDQLRLEWETLTKKIHLTEHTSNYVNERDVLKDCHLNSIHPLDGHQDMIQEFQQQLDYFDTLSNINNREDLNSLKHTFELFKRGISFAQLTTAIQDELNIVQELMSNNTKNNVTNDLIQSLEQRIHIVNTTIQGVREEYKDDLLIIIEGSNNYFNRFIDLIDNIEDNYEIVRDWVDQVRVWFIEAERIRKWIDKHIYIIEQRNESDIFNPISRDITISDQQVIKIHEEHEKLKHDIDHFDSDDMNRLRTHVKMLTNNQSQKDLTPADTSTIEITLTTLNMLNQLTLLLNNRSHLVQLLTCRVKWEDLFGQAVQWIAETDHDLDVFLKGKARWSNEQQEQEEDFIEGVIKTLVSLERKIADFDSGAYSDVLDAYQEMETLKVLPDYLEKRQEGFEQAFEDLMKRSGFSRKVVEQLLSMMNTVDKFKELRDMGEHLRYQLITTQELVFDEKVQLFKEDSARLITNASTNIPYPDVPPMLTAMGANDAHDNQITNENIRSTISAYSMSLALIADGLDQLLESRYQMNSLQQRADDAYDAMTRVKLWMEERIKLLSKSRFDIMLYSSDQSNNSSSSSTTSSSSNSSSTQLTHDPTLLLDDENLLRLEKERDGIALRLEQTENDELSKLFDTVRNLEYDVDASNAVSIDRDHLVNGVESLEKTHLQLKDLLSSRGLQLDALKKRIDWESQWSKSNSHLYTIARKLSDFNNKKARFDPAKESIEKPSYSHDQENMQSFQFIQDRMTELGDRHLTTLFECYQDMCTSYAALHAEVPDVVTKKQATLKLEYDDLRHLSSYTFDLMTQRATMTEFLIRTGDAHHEGDKIKDIISKRIRRIMLEEEEDHNLDSRVGSFKQEVKSIWEDCGKNMPFPVYNGNWLRSSNHGHHTHSNENTTANNAAGLYRSQVRAQIKSLLDKKMEELHALEKSIDQSLSMYQDADRMKSLVSQYEQEACQLGQWIDEQITSLKQQHIDVSAESFLARGMNISDLKKSRLDLYLQVDSFESKKVQVLHDQIARLVEDSVEKKKHQSVDISSAARHLGEVMDHLSQLKRGLSDQAVTLEAASMRAEWEKNLSLGIKKLEEMNEQLRQFNIKKNDWISQDELSPFHVNTLQQDLSRLVQQKTKFEKSILPGIQLSYDAFVEYFPKLSRPMATPDHLEARMDSLSRTSVRFQENVAARSKELDLIKQRMRWEDTVKQALAYLLEKELSIEIFVEEKARWHSNMDDISAVHDDDEEAKLRNEWYSLYSDFKTYEQETIAPLQKRFDALVTESTDHYNNTSVTLLPTAFMKKMQDVQSAQHRTDHYLDFSNQVVSQRCLVSAFILRTAQLEQSAELIREEFIATKLAGATHHIAGVLENHTDRLEKFKAGIQDVRQHLATSIPYPVRSLDNISTQAKLKDETTNSVIQETIDMRNTRLDELCTSLEQLLQSKERVSRRKLSLHSYKKQAKVTEAWIGTRRDILSKSNSYIVQKDDQQKSIDIEKLKEAVSQADSVEQAMKANENVFTSLNTTFDKCVTAFEDKSLDDEESQEEMTQEMTKVVKPTQDRLVEAWNNLLDEASTTTKNRTALLIENKIQTWLSALLDLSQRVHTEETKGDEHISVFSDELNKCEQDYQNLVTDVERNHKSVTHDSLFKKGLDTIKEIQAKLSSLQNELYLSQLITKYLSDITNLESVIQAQMDQLNETHEQYKKIDGDATPEARSAQHQDLTTKYKQSSDKMTDLKYAHDEVCAQYDTISSQDNTYSNDTINTVSKKWQVLTALESTVFALVSRSSNWLKYFNSLTQIHSDLQSVQLALQKAQALNDEEKDVEYEKLNVRLDDIDALLKNDMHHLLDELVQDTINAQQFKVKRDACVELKDKVKLDLDLHRVERKKLALIQSISSIISHLCEQCNDQLAVIHAHCDATLFNQVKSIKDIQSIISACTSVLKDTNSVQSSIQNEVDTIRMNQGQDLVSKLGCTETQLEELMLPILTVLKKMDQATRSENECLDVSRKLSQHVTLTTSFMDTITPCISRISSDQLNDELLTDIESQVEFLVENKNQLHSLGQDIVHYQFIDLLNPEQRTTNIHRFIESQEGDVDSKYDTFNALLQQSKMDMEKVKKRKQIISKLNDLIAYVANTSDRVTSLQLSGNNKSVSMTEERELDELCQDFYQTLVKKTKVSDTLMANNEEVTEDEEINKLKQQLDSDIAALKTLMSMKKKEASDEGDISEFLRIMHEFDQHIALLTTVIEQASPHHSEIVNDTFIKTDLQNLLKSLVGAYKEHKGVIVGVLKKAGIESKKQFLGDNERVTEITQKANKTWSQVQAAAASRERELQTCISNLDHKFFTKLAMAKTTKKTFIRPVLPPPPPAVKRSSNNNNSRYMGPHSPFPRRSMDDASSRRSSETPMSSSSSASRISRGSYVPDPRNALDMQLGRIINSHPYRITVKIVPDQVGKYWFGDENPRLVYCRILPSKLVMVRVGGGWVELSKFLREHGLTDGSYTSRPASSQEIHHGQPFQEGYLHTVRSSSPSGRVTIRGGGVASTRSSSKSSGRSKSPLPGFVDGDKYISVDEAGNHVVVKMKKADHDAKTPIIKKKDKN